MSLYSFNTPCRRWKIIAAYKGQNGWPGFLAPFAARYLNMLVKVTFDPSDLHTTDGVYTHPDGSGVNGPITVQEYSFGIDRITGAFLPGATPAGYAPFPYGLDTAQYNAANPDDHYEVIDDAHYKRIVTSQVAPLLGNAYTTTEVQLSNPYTLEQLDADADALIALADLAQMPWDTAQFETYGEVFLPLGPYTPVGDLTAMLPVGTIGFGLSSGGPIPVPQLGAAAWYVYSPGAVSADDWFPNGYLKAIAYVAMAGNYCEKTFVIDYAQNLLDEICASGRGSCADTFTVTPPPLVPGQNAYVNIVPNCQCDG